MGLLVYKQDGDICFKNCHLCAEQYLLVIVQNVALLSRNRCQADRLVMHLLGHGSRTQATLL